MSLVLCRMTFDVIVDTELESRGEIEQLVKRVGMGEADNAELDQMVVCQTVDQVPATWRGSLPYRYPNDGDEETCQQILEQHAGQKDKP